jgi:hypothetical protein
MTPTWIGVQRRPSSEIARERHGRPLVAAICSGLIRLERDLTVSGHRIGTRTAV